ncbi:MAG TPA: hypothetical protein VHZ07_06175 [Bryobacteraceae bacterium]|nr:hypothetical protein [Bryobacteraceae bacterium]
MSDQQPGVSIGAALQDRMSKRGLNFKNTKGKLAISRTLNISIPHFDALLKDKADVDDAMAAKLGELLGTGSDFWTELQKQRGPVWPYSAQVEDVTPTAGPEPVGQTTAPVIPAPASMQEVKPLSLAERHGQRQDRSRRTGEQAGGNRGASGGPATCDGGNDHGFRDGSGGDRAGRSGAA